MALLSWNEDYSVHNEELDSHHKELISILNQLYNECLKVDSQNCTGPRLEELLAYADYHFKAEEQYMRQLEYFEIDEHIEMHAGFIFKLAELQRIQSLSQMELAKELIVFLGKWLLHHVLEEDKKYALHAAGKAGSAVR